MLLFVTLVRSTELVAAVMESLENNNIVKAHKLIFGALKQLKNARLKIDFKLNEALIKLVVSKPGLFSVSSSIEVSCKFYFKKLTCVSI